MESREELTHLRSQIARTTKDVDLWKEKSEKLSAHNELMVQLTTRQQHALEQQVVTLICATKDVDLWKEKSEKLGAHNELMIQLTTSEQHALKQQVVDFI